SAKVTDAGAAPDELTGGEYAHAGLSLQHACITSLRRDMFAPLSARSGRSDMTTDDRELFEELLDDEEFAPGLTRADMLRRGAAASAALWGVSSLFGAQAAFGGTT